MQIPELKTESRLQGVSIFLSASVPMKERREEYIAAATPVESKPKYKRIDEAPLEIEEAVVSIARAVFIEGGRLVFGAHPSISPLVARVIDHYYLPAPAEELSPESDRENAAAPWKNPSLLIYQSRVWEKHWAEATERLTRHPLVNVKWIDADPDETVDPDDKTKPQAPRSMDKMRQAMIEETAPAAMIAIGGMQGVFDEAKLFARLRPEQPIFTLVTTGGAAALLPEQLENSDRVRVMDDQAEGLVRSFWEQPQEREPGEQKTEETPRKFYVPYAFVAQQIVAQIVEGHESKLSPKNDWYER